MSICTLMIDRRLGLMPQRDAEMSLLLAPVGTGCLLQELAAAAPGDQAAIYPLFMPDERYRAAVQALAPRHEVLTRQSCERLLYTMEPSDSLLVIDPRWWPGGRFEYERLTRSITDYRLAQYLMHLPPNPGGTRERVTCGDGERVRSVERLYDGVTDVGESGISALLMSAAVARSLPSLEVDCLAALRTQLTGKGLPLRALLSPTAALDLATEEGWLTLCERTLVADATLSKAPGYTALAPGIWAAAGHNIHSTSRIYGPVVLQAGVEIGPRAVLIGPALVGAGARLEADAIVVRSVVAPGAVVAAGTRAAHRVLSGEVHAGTNGAAADWHSRLAIWSARHNSANGADTRPADQRRYDQAKRVLDCALALIGLIVLMPLLVLFGVLVKFTSRGPIFFGHEREGRGGRVFRCWKFRTMVDRAHQMQRALYNRSAVDGPQFKIENDPRVTLLGRFMRSTNIDEIPQLYNVVRGQMSLIGPRPSPFRENQICVPWRKARLSVRPGITGLWQVCRHDRRMGDFHQWIHFDMLYVRHRSFALDLKILLATFLTLGGRYGAPLDWLIPPRRRAMGVLSGKPAAAVRPAREAVGRPSKVAIANM